MSDERGKAEAVIDVRTDKVVKTLHFDSETGMPQYDPISRKVYVNLQDQNVIAEIDPATDTVIARYPVGKCEGNHGMALDPQHRRAFLACEENNLLTVFDLEKRQPIAFLPLPEGPDVVNSIPGCAACTSLVPLGRSLSFTRTTLSISANWKTSRYRRTSTAWE